MERSGAEHRSMRYEDISERKNFLFDVIGLIPHDTEEREETFHWIMKTEQLLSKAVNVRTYSMRYI
jgi:hypothetical protein